MNDQHWRAKARLEHVAGHIRSALDNIEQCAGQFTPGDKIERARLDIKRDLENLSVRVRNLREKIDAQT